MLEPTVRRSVADGEKLTVRVVEREHQQIKDLVAEIRRLAPETPEREKVRRAFALMREDIRDEEDLPLRRLQDCVHTAQLHRPRTVWEAVRKSPPRPRIRWFPDPRPETPLLGVPLSTYDRMRDALDRRGWPS